MIKTKNSRSRLCRLEELEEFVQDHYDTEPTSPITAPEILEYYERCAETRLFEREPDFQATLAEFISIMKDIPPERHIPTEDFEPDKPERRRLYIWNIRHEITELRPIYVKLRRHEQSGLPRAGGSIGNRVRATQSMVQAEHRRSANALHDCRGWENGAEEEHH